MKNKAQIIGNKLTEHTLIKLGEHNNYLNKCSQIHLIKNREVRKDR